jgi:hypothetical protein
MKYILVELLDEGTQAYQEICRDNFVRFTDMLGNTISHSPCCKVIDSMPIQPIWALPDSIVTPINYPKVISKLDYMSRFTDAELATIYTIAKTSIQLEIWLEKFKVSQEIDLSNPITLAGLKSLEALGILAAGRALEIANA